MKNTVTVMAILLLCVPLCLNGDQWGKIYGGNEDDEAYSIRQTSDGGYVVAGSTRSFGAEGRDAWIIKLDGSGGIEWQKMFSGLGDDPADQNDEFMSVQQTADGGYIAAGYVPFCSCGGNYSNDISVLKLDTNGNVNWHTCISDDDSSGHSHERAHYIEQTGDNGYIIAGERRSTSGSSELNFFILKLNAGGELVGSRHYGGDDDDIASCIRQTGDGGYIVTGRTRSFGAGNDDIWVLKLDSDLDVEWQKTFGGSGTDDARYISQTGDGGYIIAGTTNSFGAGNDDIWMIKLDGNGDVDWEKTYGGSDDDDACSVQVTGGGGYLVAGTSESFSGSKRAFWVLKLETNGDIDWEKVYGGTNSDRAYSMVQTDDNGFAVAGRSRSFNASGYDFCVFKMDMDGELPESCGFLSDTSADVDDTSGDTDIPSGISPGGAGICDGLTSMNENPTDAIEISVCESQEKVELTITTGDGGTTSPAPGVHSYTKNHTVPVTAIPDEHYVFTQWTGDVSAGKKNHNPLSVSMDSDKGIRANFKRKVYPPSNANGDNVENRSLSQIEYINVLTWQDHPGNHGISILKYLIFLKEGNSRTLLAETRLGVHEYWHRHVEKDKQYVYQIVTVSTGGRQSDAATVIIE